MSRNGLCAFILNVAQARQKVSLNLDESLNQREPQYCNVIITQPPRVAAIKLAELVAAEGQEPVGKIIGYCVGRDIHRAGHTKVTYCTIEYFVQVVVHNLSAIQSYTHIILDEVHECSMDTDFVMLVVKRLLSTRQRTKIILMSATLQDMLTKHFEETFHISLVSSPYFARAKLYPVKQCFYDDLSDLADKLSKIQSLLNSMLRRTPANLVSEIRSLNSCDMVWEVVRFGFHSAVDEDIESENESDELGDIDALDNQKSYYCDEFYPPMKLAIVSKAVINEDPSRNSRTNSVFSSQSDSVQDVYSQGNLRRLKSDFKLSPLAKPFVPCVSNSDTSLATASHAILSKAVINEDPSRNSRTNSVFSSCSDSVQNVYSQGNLRRLKSDFKLSPLAKPFVPCVSNSDMSLATASHFEDEVSSVVSMSLEDEYLSRKVNVSEDHTEVAALSEVASPSSVSFSDHSKVLDLILPPPPGFGPMSLSEDHTDIAALSEVAAPSAASYSDHSKVLDLILPPPPGFGPMSLSENHTEVAALSEVAAPSAASYSDHSKVLDLILPPPPGFGPMIPSVASKVHNHIDNRSESIIGDECCDQNNENSIPYYPFSQAPCESLSEDVLFGESISLTDLSGAPDIVQPKDDQCSMQGMTSISDESPLVSDSTSAHNLDFSSGYDISKNTDPVAESAAFHITHPVEELIPAPSRPSGSVLSNLRQALLDYGIPNAEKLDAIMKTIEQIKVTSEVIGTQEVVDPTSSGSSDDDLNHKTDIGNYHFPSALLTPGNSENDLLNSRSHQMNSINVQTEESHDNDTVTEPKASSSEISYDLEVYKESNEVSYDFAVENSVQCENDYSSLAIVHPTLSIVSQEDPTVSLVSQEQSIVPLASQEHSTVPLVSQESGIDSQDSTASQNTDSLPVDSSLDGNKYGAIYCSSLDSGRSCLTACGSLKSADSWPNVEQEVPVAEHTSSEIHPSVQTCLVVDVSSSDAAIHVAKAWSADHTNSQEEKKVAPKCDSRSVHLSADNISDGIEMPKGQDNNSSRDHKESTTLTKAYHSKSSSHSLPDQKWYIPPQRRKLAQYTEQQSAAVLECMQRILKDGPQTFHSIVAHYRNNFPNYPYLCTDYFYSNPQHYTCTVNNRNNLSVSLCGNSATGSSSVTTKKQQPPAGSSASPKSGQSTSPSSSVEVTSSAEQDRNIVLKEVSKVIQQNKSNRIRCSQVRRRISIGLRPSERLDRRFFERHSSLFEIEEIRDKIEGDENDFFVSLVPQRIVSSHPYPEHSRSGKLKGNKTQSRSQSRRRQGGAIRDDSEVSTAHGEGSACVPKSSESKAEGGASYRGEDKKRNKMKQHNIEHFQEGVASKDVSRRHGLRGRGGYRGEPLYVYGSGLPFYCSKAESDSEL